MLAHYKITANYCKVVLKVNVSRVLVETCERLSTNEPRHEISNNVVCATSKASDQPAHTPSLIRAFASCLNNLYEY